MALWEAETRHARELSVFGEKRALLYTGVCELFLSIYRCARLCPVVPGFARTCESSRPDSKPSPHAQVLLKAVAWQAKLPQTTNTTTTTTTTTKIQPLRGGSGVNNIVIYKGRQ